MGVQVRTEKKEKAAKYRMEAEDAPLVLVMDEQIWC